MNATEKHVAIAAQMYECRSTAREIAYAKHLGKPVVYLEPPMTAADIFNEAAGRG